MASRYPEIDIMPKAGIDLRDPTGPEWVANMWRINRAAALEIRPGFGQVTQQDSTTMQANPGGNPVGGYQEHLGSFLYRSNFGHNQVLSVFSAFVDSSNLKPVSFETGYDTDLFLRNTVQGFYRCIVCTIYDLTSQEMWEEPLVIRTTEKCLTNADIPDAFGQYETRMQAVGTPTEKHDNRGFHDDVEASPVSFLQMGDSVIIAGGSLGTWIYHGIDVAEAKQRKINGANTIQTQTATVYRGFNSSTGESEGSVIQPIGGTSGINGENQVYFNRSEFPRPAAVTTLGNRAIYGQRDTLYFSDVAQAGAVVASNFASIQTDRDITALSQFNGVLFAFTPNETHLLALRPGTVVGDPTGNLVAATHVKLSDLTGCVSQAAIVETPFGICWISERGIHQIGSQQAIQDLSDSIQAFWTDGIVDPVSNYYTASGAGGTNKQPSIIYQHHGKPTIAYDRVNETLLAAYSDCILAYQFRAQSWAVWPLGTVQHAAAVQRDQTLKPLQILSDDKNVYLVGGLIDSNETGDTPAAQPPSFHLVELGRGGALDRSCRDEDHRRYAWGYYQSKRPTVITSSGISWHHRFYVNEPRRIFLDRANSKVCYEVQIDFEVVRDSTAGQYYPADTGVGAKDALRLKLSFHTNWDLETPIGIFSESAPYGDFAFTTTATTAQIYRTFLGNADVRPVGTRMPLCLLRFYASSTIDVVPAINVDEARIHPQGGGGTYKDIIGYVWEPVHRFATATSTDSDRLATGVQWGIKTGQIGVDQGLQLRSRGIFAFMSTHGSPNGELYNTYVSSDDKLRSGQYPDFNSPTVANSRAVQIQTIRDRMYNSGKRIFANAGDTVPKYVGGAPPSAASERYLIDSEELDSITTSQSARGEHLTALMYGFADDKADHLALYRAKMPVLEVGNRRRTGR